MCWAWRNGSASRIVSPNVCVGAAVFLCLVGIVCILFYHVSPIFCVYGFFVVPVRIDFVLGVLYRVFF